MVLTDVGLGTIRLFEAGQEEHLESLSKESTLQIVIEAFEATHQRQTTNQND